MQVKRDTKESFRRLSLGLYCIAVCLLLVQSAHARLSLEDIKAVQEKVTELSDSGNLAVNPKESLSFLRGYLFYKNGFMYNKRLYSPEIKTDYSLEVDPNSKHLDSFVYTRTPCNDTVYPVKDEENEKQKMLYAYHEKILQLFPSPRGDLSIEAIKPDTFVNFLRAEIIKEHAYDILASLFLLTQGVNVPIEYVNDNNGKEEFVLRNYEEQGEEKHYKLSTSIPIYNPDTNCVEDIRQSEAVDIINFFIKNRSRVPEPTTITTEQF